MKKSVIYLLLALIFMTCTACGQAQETGSGLSSETAESVENTSEIGVVSESVDMLYYLDLGGGSIMAACYTDEGIAVMGNDYYVIHVGEAEIYNTAGQSIPLEKLTRGCPIRITWPGMVMESYPGQIAAEKVEMISDEPDPTVPAEDEIQPVNGGPKWWEPEMQTELPNIVMEYTTPDFATAVFLSGQGEWNYLKDGKSVGEVSCGDDPRNWTYDDNDTCKRVGFDTVRFSCGVQYASIEVVAYVDGGEEAVSVPVGEDGTIELLDGSEVIYVIKLRWETTQYNGNGEYGVKIVVPQEN